jgi:hypothetical protein
MQQREVPRICQKRSKSPCNPWIRVLARHQTEGDLKETILHMAPMTDQDAGLVVERGYRREGQA